MEMGMHVKIHLLARVGKGLMLQPPACGCRQELPRRLCSKLTPLLLRFLSGNDHDWQASVEFSLKVAKEEKAWQKFVEEVADIERCDVLNDPPSALAMRINQLLADAMGPDGGPSSNSVYVREQAQFADYVTLGLKYDPKLIHEGKLSLVDRFSDLEATQWIQTAKNALGRGNDRQQLESRRVELQKLEQLLVARLKQALTPFPRRAWEEAAARIPEGKAEKEWLIKELERLLSKEEMRVCKEEMRVSKEELPDLGIDHDGDQWSDPEKVNLQAAVPPPLHRRSRIEVAKLP
jgi:hypothetical protein